MKVSVLIRWVSALVISFVVMSCKKPAEVAPTPSLELMTLDKVRAITSLSPPGSIYVTDANKQGAFVLDADDTKSEDNTGTILVTASGKRYKRDFIGAASAAWFGVSSTDANIGPALQKAIDASTDLFIPDGNYTQLTQVNLKSNIKIHANPGKVIINLPDDYISFKHVYTLDTLYDVTIDGLGWTLTSKQTVDGSYGPITIDGPSMNNIVVRNCTSIHTSPTANVNWFFIKISPGKTATNITVENNYVKGGRMGAELLNQTNVNIYAGKYININNNFFENCGFGISVAGTFDIVETNNNYLKNCPTYGIEFAGALRNVRATNNKFEGNFIVLIAGNWIRDGNGSITTGMQITDNRTVGTCKGNIAIYNGGAMLFANNILNMEGRLFLHDDTAGGTITGNTIIVSNDQYAVYCDNAGNNRFIGNTLSNKSATNNIATFMSNDVGAKNNVLLNNIIIKGAGGVAIGAQAGGSNKVYENYDENGDLIK